MSLFRPGAAEERWLALGARLPAARDGYRIAESRGHWKTLSLLKRGAFFLLGIVCSGLVFGVLELMHLPGYPWLCAATLVGAAEWLIVRRRLFGCGFEEALEGAALLIVAIFAVDFRLGHDSTLWWLVAAALGFGGLRLLNPLFTTVSVIALATAVHAISALHLHDAPSAALLTGGFCFAIGAAALACCGIEFRRPSYDRMVEWLVIAMPACGYLWIALGRAEPPNLWLTVSLPLAFGGVALAVGIHQRLHAPFAAFMVCAACLAYEVRRFSGFSLQERLLLGGSAVLLIAFALDRYLREPRKGITSRQLNADATLDLLQLVGYVGLAQPGPGPAGNDRFKGGGGASSGGGASGNY